MKIKLPNQFILLIFFFFIITNSLYSQDTVKVMAYNLLNYNGSVVKDQSFRKIVGFVNPDIFVAEEVISQSAVNNLTNVLNSYNPGLYASGTFFNGYDTDNAVFYKPSKFTFLYNFVIQTTLRTINLFGLVHNQTGQTIKLFAVHLKASNSSSDQQQRLNEVNVLREFTNSLPNGSEFAVLGDFNIYKSTEPAYQRLLQIDAGSEGYFIDMLNLSGTWNNAAYAPYHTQSSRTVALGDSGSTGGLDDRFDMILNSKGLVDDGGIKYIPGSLKPIGNDGNHYNSSMNVFPNASVPDSVALALYYGSDHLPVTVLYKFDMSSSVKNISGLIPETFKVYQNFPNPFNPSTKIKFDIPNSAINGFGNIADVKITIYNSLGVEINTLVNEKLSAGVYEVEFEGLNYSSGIYFYKFNAGNFTQTKSMMLVK